MRRNGIEHRDLTCNDGQRIHKKTLYSTLSAHIMVQSHINGTIKGDENGLINDKEDLDTSVA